MGLTTSDVYQTIQLMLAPVYVNDFYYEGRVLRATMQADAPFRMNENALQHFYLPAGTSLPTRVHGAFVSDAEVHRVVEVLKKTGAPNYIEDVLEGPGVPLAGISGESGEGAGGADGGEQDALYDEAVKIVTTERKPSISYVQRRLKIGYNRAARLLESMENAGVVGPLQPNGAREILAPAPPGND
jgi:S-DNA-T family DNA segregation ATPase FtsK/SpoIIIE